MTKYYKDCYINFDTNTWNEVLCFKLQQVCYYSFDKSFLKLTCPQPLVHFPPSSLPTPPPPQKKNQQQLLV